MPVITQQEADYILDQQDVRKIVMRHNIDTVLDWVMALKLGLPLRPYDAPEPGTIGDPRR